MRLKSMTNEELSNAICDLGKKVKSGNISLHEAMKKAAVYDAEIKRRNRKIFKKQRWWKFWKQ